MNQDGGGYFVGSLGDVGGYVKYEIVGDDEVEVKVKPKNCVGVVTLMALCF